MTASSVAFTPSQIPSRASDYSSKAKSPSAIYLAAPETCATERVIEAVIRKESTIPILRFFTAVAVLEKINQAGALAILVTAS